MLSTKMQLGSYWCMSRLNLLSHSHLLRKGLVRQLCLCKVIGCSAAHVHRQPNYLLVMLIYVIGDRPAGR
jgi:hypothetical protein